MSRSGPGGATRRRDRTWRDTRIEGLALLRATYRTQRFAPHAHDSWVIGTLTSGRASCFGTDHPVAENGTVVVIPPGRPHGGESPDGKPWRWRAVYASESLLAELGGRDASSAPRCPEFGRLVIPDRELSLALALVHRSALEDSTAGAEERVVEVLGLLLDRHGRGRRGERPAAPDRARIARSVELVEDRLGESLSLGDIAEPSGYSRFHFLRVFKELMGQTPHAYVVARRVERAKGLLRRGRPLAAVAYETGFSDQAHFTRRFRQLVGVTPGEFSRGAGPRRPATPRRRSRVR